MQRKLLEIISVDFDAIGQLPIIYFIFVKYLRKKWEYNEAVHKLFIDLKSTFVLQLRGKSCIIFSLGLVSSSNW